MTKTVALAALERRYGRNIEWPEVASIDRRRALRMPLSDEQRAIFVATGEAQMKAIRLWAAQEARDAWQEWLDCRQHPAAPAFYASVRARPSRAVPRLRPRAVSARPARRERRAPSRDGSRASDDDDGEPDAELALATRRAATA